MGVLRKPCCKKFENFTTEYVDLVLDDDDRLRLLSELLMRVQVDVLPLTNTDLRSVAHEIDQDLNRKVVREHVLFNRTLQRCSFGDAEIKIEIARIKESVRPA